MKFNLMCKAKADDGEVITGFYIPWAGKHYIVNSLSASAEEINPYPVCKNTEVLDKNGLFVYEYDLLKCQDFTDSFYAYAEWSKFEKRYVLRRFFDMGGFSDFARYTIEVIGNVMLSDADRMVIERQEKAENEKDCFIDGSYCSSCFKR